MKNLFRSDSRFPGSLAPVLLSESKDPLGKQSEISDEIYRRIPNQFKTPPENDETPDRSDSPDSQNDDSPNDGSSDESNVKNNDQNQTPSSQDSSSSSKETNAPRKNDPYAPKSWRSNSPRWNRVDPDNSGKNGRSPHNNDNNGNAPQNAPSTSRSPFSLIFYLLMIFFIGYIMYGMYFSPKTTEISWNGFNLFLENEERLVDSVNLKGNSLTGTFKRLPKIDELFEILPNATKQFEKMAKKQNSKITPEELAETLKSPSEYWGYAPLLTAKKNNEDQDGYEIVFLPTGKRTGKLIYLRFHCEVPASAFADQELDDRIRKFSNSYTSTTPSDNTGIFMLISILISVIVFVALFRMMRRTNEQMMGGGGFGAFNRSPAKRYDPANQPVTFADVAGLDNVKSELVEIVDFLKNPDKYERMGARVPKGTLLFGPPGTGKTLLGRAVAGEAGVPFFSINGSEFIQMFVGVGASRVRDLFNAAKENAPAILFIDEIDAVGRLRGTGVGGGHDEREQTLNQILSEMDGFSQNESVMVMAATNRPDVLDPALMRPGRFDRHITVDRPSLKGRIDIFNVYLNKIPKADDVDVEKLAKSTVGFTGADIRNLVNEATLWATRNDKNLVYMEDFDFAHEKVVMGLKREEVISDADKRKTAYHEAGHTILGWFSGINSKVFKVTIIPRGRSLGATYFFPDEEQVNVDQKQIEATLVRYLGGRAAEKVVYNETSAGAENDLKEATQLARRMVIHWGMSEKLGPVAFRAAEASPFLGREMSEFREYSEATAQLIDEEIVRIMRDAANRAEKTLTEKRELLEKLTDVLVEEEELDQNRLTEILGPIV